MVVYPRDRERKLRVLRLNQRSMVQVAISMLHFGMAICRLKFHVLMNLMALLTVPVICNYSTHTYGKVTSVQFLRTPQLVLEIVGTTDSHVHG